MNKTGMIGMACICLLFSGCMVISGNDFDPEKYNLFKDANRVGGGLEITYIAPEDGVINLVDRKSGKNLMSKSVVAGEKYEFSAKTLDPDNEKQWGVDVKKADFVLYFFPNKPFKSLQGQMPQLPPLPQLPPAQPQPPQP